MPAHFSGFDMGLCPVILAQAGDDGIGRLAGKPRQELRVPYGPGGVAAIGRKRDFRGNITRLAGLVGGRP